MRNVAKNILNNHSSMTNNDRLGSRVTYYNTYFKERLQVFFYLHDKTKFESCVR